MDLQPLFKNADVENLRIPLGYSLYSGDSCMFYAFNSNGAFNVSGTVEGSAAVFNILAADTSSENPGRYQYAVRVSHNSYGLTVASGEFVLMADPTAGAQDSRTHARRVLDAIEAVIEGRATKDQMSVSVAGYSISRMTVSELFELRDRYRQEVVQEKYADDVAHGLESGNTVRVRFK